MLPSFHLLIAEGVWRTPPAGPEFRRVPPPTRAQLERLLATLTKRIARHLVRRGWLSADAGGAQLTGEDLGDSGLGQLRAHSITYRIAVGPHTGRKALTLRTLPGRDPDEPPAGLLAKADGFSLHAGVTVGARDSAKRERLCRYLARPPVAHDRLSLTRDGRVTYALKTLYRDGTTHVVLEPQELDGAHPCAPPFGRPAVVQIGSPADLSSRASRRWCRARGPTLRATTACSRRAPGGGRRSCRDSQRRHPLPTGPLPSGTKR